MISSRFEITLCRDDGVAIHAAKATATSTNALDPATMLRRRFDGLTRLRRRIRVVDVDVESIASDSSSDLGPDVVLDIANYS